MFAKVISDINLLTAKILLFVCLIIVTPENFGQLFINEFLASNVTTNPDNHDFDDYSDWLELYNAGDSAVDLGGYFLTDNLNRPGKWMIPPGTVIESKGFLLFWADGRDDEPGNSYIRPWTSQWGPGLEVRYTTNSYHLNFKLSKEGEELGLFDPDTMLIDRIVFDQQWPDVSRGRQPDGGSTFYYFGEPTPGDSNTRDKCNWFDFSGEPQISPEGNFYKSNQSVVMTTSSSSASIKYTTDGSKPSSTSPEYSVPLEITSTTVLRARVFEPGKLPGKIITQTYFINETNDLPVISIAAFPSTLWDKDIGIYENELKQREIPVSIEFYEPDGIKGFSVDAGMTMTGEFSLMSPQKPFTIYTKSKFGDDEIIYQVFKNKPIGSYKAIYLRNSGYPDNFLTLLRDALSQSLVIDQMDIDCQAYRPAVVYLNGEYWGIYNIREKLNEDYLVSNHGVNEESLDILEYMQEEVPEVVEGESVQYLNLLNAMQSMDMTIPENYEIIREQIDIDEYMNYMISEIYFANWVWLNINIKWWRERSGNKKWRWILFDTDMGFGTPTEELPDDGYSHNTLAYALSTYGQINNPQWATFLFRKLMDNPDFKIEFIQRFASHLNTTFHKDRVLGVIDSLKTNITGGMPRHISRWKNSYSDLGIDPIRDMRIWENNVKVLETFASQRPWFIRQHILGQFNLSGTASLNVYIQEPGSGKVFINNVEITDTSKTTKYFKDVPLELNAIPNVGYQFVGWLGIQDGNSASVTLTLDRDSSLTAVFEPDNINMVSAEIAGTVTLTGTESPYAAAGDIIVNPDATLILEAGTELRMAEGANIYVYGEIHLNGNKGNPVLIGPDSIIGADHWGAICFKDATGHSTLSHVRMDKPTKGEDLVYYKAAITGYNSDITMDHVELKADFPFFSEKGKIRIINSVFRSDRTCDLINIRDTDSALVEKCDLKGNDKYDTDAVDYDNVANGIIRGNKIYDFWGENSDGIDLGEGAKNILIENNLIYNCSDKGISVGQASTAVVRRNIIVSCGQGVGIKDFNSYAWIDHNTFHNNGYGVACFEKNFLAGSGKADIINTIFSGSVASPFLVDDPSSISLNYCLSNGKALPGTTNLRGDPMYVNASSMDFRLNAGSICINSGDPESATDPDGSRTDIGALEYSPVGYQSNMESSTGLLIYPNPTINMITIETNNPGQQTIGIISMNGQLLYSRKIKGSTLQIDLSSFHKGIYFITVRTRDYVRTQKIIKL